ncbi:MAG: hypothetical protein ABI779_08255 [Acidobacteriota bacterium]
MSEVESLRLELKARGYLSHGIERWFALDPWSSRAFWTELALVALKAATLIAAFAALPMTAIMVGRNFPLGGLETLGLYVTYAAAWLVAAFLFVVGCALILKLRPELPIDTPRTLLALSFVAAAVLLSPLALWWWRFDAAPSIPEWMFGASLSVLVFLITSVVIAAALLSFSIYEVKRIPAFHQKSRTGPMIAAAAVLVALLFVPAYTSRERASTPPMVVTSPTLSRFVLIAVDGLTDEILESRPGLANSLVRPTALPPLAGESAAERWASLGTGVPTELHGVRGIEGVRFRGGSHMLQRISRADFVLMQVAPAVGLARREPLPPTVRRRDYVAEILAERGLPSVSINWWATADQHGGGLHVTGPESIFPSSGGDAIKVDALAKAQLLVNLDHRQPRFAAVYLPALDVVLNRLPLDPSARLAQSLRALEGIEDTIAVVRGRHYGVILIGLPGDGQRGHAVLASTQAWNRPPETAWDVVPTLLDLFGFPLSSEMPGHSLVGQASSPRIPTYGDRAPGQATPLNEEYYENLKSLGYIR